MLMKKIEQDDPRPITVQLIRNLEKCAANAAAEATADAERISCQHPAVDRHANFCRHCGALMSLANAMGMIPALGVAFALQQILAGNAIAEAQRGTC